MNWKLFLLSIASIFSPAALVNKADACAGGWEEPTNWFMNPELSGMPELSPLFLSDLSFGGKALTLDNPSQEKLVLQDWSRYTANRFDTLDIRTVLFQPGNQGKESAFQDWLRNRPAGALYLQFLSRWSRIHTSNDPWGDVVWPWTDKNGINQTHNNDIAACRKLLVDMAKLKPDTFLLRRMGYQAVRMAWYYPQKGDPGTKSVFEKYFTHGSKDWLYHSAMHYVALAENGSSRAEYLAKSFVGTQDKIIRTVQLFDPAELPGLLESATLNNREKAAALCMALLQKPRTSLAELEKLIELEPDNRFLPLLLHREINKADQLHMVLHMQGYSTLADDEETWDTLPGHYPDYVKLFTDSLRGFIIKAKQKRTTGLGHFALMAGWLSMLNGDYSACSEYIRQETNTPFRRDEKLQWRVLQNLGELQKGLKIKQSNAALEEDLLQTWLTFKSYKALSEGESQLFANWLRYASWGLIQMNQKAKGILMGMNGDMGYGYGYGYNYRLGGSHDFLYSEITSWLNEQGSAADFDEALQLVQKPGKTGFEKWICHSNQDHTPGSALLTRIQLLKGMWYTGADSLEAAINVYRQLPDSVLSRDVNGYSTDIGDPFFVDYTGRDYSGKPTAWMKSMNRLEVLQHIVRLHKRMEADKTNEMMYRYFLGNAYLSMSWSGTNWEMVKNSRSWYPQYSSTGLQAGYHYCKFAAREYKAVLAKSKDPALAVLAARQLGAIYGISLFMKNQCNLYEINSYATTTENPYYNWLVQSGAGRHFNRFSADCDLVVDYYEKAFPRIYPMGM
ncbi:MAG: hypothetical protein JNL57_06905 [Bacteroidetes bacterium]|nr:hypothetical protein [Bacteroidota bacterium]